LEKDICGSNFLEPGPKLFSTGDVADPVGDLGGRECLMTEEEGKEGESMIKKEGMEGRKRFEEEGTVGSEC